MLADAIFIPAHIGSDISVFRQRRAHIGQDTLRIQRKRIRACVLAGLQQKSLALRSLRLRRLTLSSPGRTHRSLADHARLVGALEDRDGELASALIKANVLGALKLLEQLLADGDKKS